MRTLGELGEFGLIDRLARMLPNSPLVVEGIGDDCAVLRFGERMLLVSTDLFIEGVHFRREWAGAIDIGWKAASSSLSDIAAMGGSPLFCLVSLACPADTTAAYIEQVYQGMSAVLSRFGAVIVGGDTTCTASGITLDIIILGETVGSRCLRRHGAESGDLVVVTGRTGLAGAGLHALRHGIDEPELVQFHRRPTPRISEGQWLCRHSSVHAMIDISDGLAQDIEHIAYSSYLGVDLRSRDIPIAPELSTYCSTHGLDPLKLALTSGEDYELAFVVSSSEADSMLAAFHHEFRLETTVIGSVTDQWIGLRLDGNPAEISGFDHFRSAPE